jgi:hypothetical protein
MRPYIEDIVNVEDGGYCGYRVVALDIRKNEDDYELVKLNTVNEINLHKKLYEKVFGGKKRMKNVTDALVFARKHARGVAPLEKWFTFPDMGHVIATYYGKIVVNLTKPSIGVSMTFFPLRGSQYIFIQAFFSNTWSTICHNYYLKLYLQHALILSATQ